MRILVLDDEELVRSLLKKTLEREGYEVDVAVNGREGLKMFENTNYDLVITDILMPEMEGIETIIAMRGLEKTTPVLAISGGGRSANFDFLDMAQRLGARATLRKPFKPDQLLEQVRIAVAEHILET